MLAARGSSPMETEGAMEVEYNGWCGGGPDAQGLVKCGGGAG